MGEMIFEIGATVKLRGGGPLMTIVLEDGPKAWMCAWFDIGDHMHRESISERALYREEPKEGAQS